MIKDFQHILDAKKEYEKQLRTAGKESFTTYFKGILEANPKVKAIKWTQYTPYFNDGEPCVFGLGSVIVVDQEDNEHEGWLYSKENEFENLRADIHSELEKLEDVIEAVFGDHAEVIVTRDGVEVEGYDHE